MQMNKFLIYTLLVFSFSSCIGDDILEDNLDPEIRISNLIDTLAVNTDYQFTYNYLNNVGRSEQVDVQWSSSDPSIIAITSEGLASGLQTGSAAISVSFDNGSSLIEETKTVVVGETTTEVNVTERIGTIATTSSYVLAGDFVLKELSSGDLELSFGDDYVASSSLPGLFVYLSNNPNSISGSLEISAVDIFEGSHSYLIQNTDLDEYAYVLYYCKPFNVKVGDGEIQ